MEGIAARIRVGCIGVRISIRGKLFVCCTQPSVRWVPEFFLGDEACGALSLPPSNADVKNEWSLTSYNRPTHLPNSFGSHET